MTRLLRQLWAQPHAAYPFRSLAQMCAAWADKFEQEYAAATAADRIDPGLARAGIALFRALPETTESRVPLCTELHGGNILAAQRAPWLVIDPKPYLGDPAYDVPAAHAQLRGQAGRRPGRDAEADGRPGRD